MLVLPDYAYRQGCINCFLKKKKCFSLRCILRESDPNAFAETPNLFENSCRLFVGFIIFYQLSRRLKLSQFGCLLSARAVIIGVFIRLVSLLSHGSIIMPYFQEYSFRALPSLCLVLELTAMLNFPGFVTICSRWDTSRPCVNK